MALNYERVKEKESEILSDISVFLLSNNVSHGETNELSRLILNKAISVTPPEKEEHMMHMLTVHLSGRGGGKSQKLGNIKLNISKLVDCLANGTFLIAGATQVPILIPMAFIILWKSLNNVTEIELSENDAGVIWAMWVYRDRSKNIIPNTGLLNIINGHFKKYERSPINQKDLDNSLNKLVKIRSIKRSKASTDNWWLCEIIRAQYK